MKTLLKLLTIKGKIWSGETNSKKPLWPLRKGKWFLLSLKISTCLSSQSSITRHNSCSNSPMATSNLLLRKVQLHFISLLDPHKGIFRQEAMLNLSRNSPVLYPSLRDNPIKTLSNKYRAKAGTDSTLH